MIQQGTFMNDILIKKARDEGRLVICPYDENNLTPVGYNLSFSRFIVSLRKSTFIKVHHKGDEWYFNLKPNETVLVLTRETIWVSKFIGGTFHSKVSLVTKGLGHVSTTLDPGWHGQLLVPINNPTKEPIKIIIAKDSNQGIKFETFITMVLFQAQEASLYSGDSNKAARVELLEEILKEKKRNKDAEFLRKVYEKVRNSITRMELFDDLNDPKDRIDKIKRFQLEHLDLIRQMDDEFDHINQYSKKTYNLRAGFFWGIVGLLIMLIVGAGIWLWKADNLDNKWLSIATLLFSSLIPIIIFIMGHVKDKYI